MSLAFLPGHLRLILLTSLVYLLAWLSYYGQVTLGQFPSPYAAETIAGALVSAPSTGHSLYEALLHAIGGFVESKEGLITAARTLNAIALLIATALCANTAGHFWKSNRAACAAALLIGINPMLAFQVGQPNPSILAVLCISVFAWAFFHWIRHPSTKHSLLAGGALALGTAFDTSLIGLAILWPVAAFLYPQRHKVTHLILASTGPAIILALLTVSSLQLQQTLQFDTSGIGAKLYALISNQENNTGPSYALHHRLHLLLFLNPIHWGLLFTLAALGSYSRFKDGHKGYSIYACLLGLVVFAIAYALNSGDSQTRLVIIPLLTIFAAGSIALIPKIWHHASPRTRRNLLCYTGICAALTYSASLLRPLTAADMESEYTFMAEANAALGKDKAAVIWAEKTLAINPERPDMHNVRVQAHFNDWAMVSQPKPLSIETVKAYLMEIEQADDSSPTIASIKGIYLWKLERFDAARALWQANASESALAQVALIWTSKQSDPPADVQASDTDRYTMLLQTARSIHREHLIYGKDEKLIDNLFAKAH